MSLETYIEAITSLPLEEINEQFLIELTPHLTRKEHNKLIKIYQSCEPQYLILPPIKVNDAYNIAYMANGKIKHKQSERLPSDKNLGAFFKTNKEAQKRIKNAINYANENWDLIEDNWKYFAACDSGHMNFFAFNTTKIVEQTQNTIIARELQGERTCIYFKCEQKPTLKELREYIPKKTEPIDAEKITIF